jgi:hypothetical protein
MYHFLYPFIGCWAPQLIPQLDYCEENCNKHGCGGICLVYSFTFLGVYAQEWYGGIIKVKFILSFLRNLPSAFHSGRISLHSHQ